MSADRDVHVAALERDAHALAESMKAAVDAGVGPAVILPTLLNVFREAGIFAGGMPDLPGGLAGMLGQ